MKIVRMTEKNRTYYLARERLPLGKLLLAEGETVGEAFLACLTLIKENSIEQGRIMSEAQSQAYLEKYMSVKVKQRVEQINLSVSAKLKAVK